MKDLEPILFAEDFMFLEAPKWRDGRLWVSDVFGHELHALSSEGHREWQIAIPNRPSGLGFLSNGNLVIASAKDQKLLWLDGETLREYADLSNHAGGWLNDFAIDMQDRIFVGDFGYDFAAGAPRMTTSLHRVDPDRSIRAVADMVDFPNGSVVIDQGRTLIVAETWEGRITAFDLSDEGELNHRRLFADLGTRQPDGLCADRNDAIWVGIYNTGEFLRILDGGDITHRVRLDGHAVSCTLGGLDGHTLFMTAFVGTEKDMADAERKSAIFTVRVEVPGHGAPSTPCNDVGRSSDLL